MVWRLWSGGPSERGRPSIIAFRVCTGNSVVWYNRSGDVWSGHNIILYAFCVYLITSYSTGMPVCVSAHNENLHRSTARDRVNKRYYYGIWARVSGRVCVCV